MGSAQRRDRRHALTCTGSGLDSPGSAGPPSCRSSRTTLACPRDRPNHGPARCGGVPDALVVSAPAGRATAAERASARATATAGGGRTEHAPGWGRMAAAHPDRSGHAGRHALPPRAATGPVRQHPSRARGGCCRRSSSVAIRRYRARADHPAWCARPDAHRGAGAGRRGRGRDQGVEHARRPAVGSSAPAAGRSGLRRSLPAPVGGRL